MPDVRWLGYDELAADLGVTRESARQLTIRRRWARRKGNDGKARVGVPVETLEARTSHATGHDTLAHTPAATSDETADGTGHDTSDLTHQLAVARVEVTGLRDALARSEATAAVYRADLEAYRTDLEAEREKTWGLVADLRRLAERMAEVEVARARPWWRRLAGR